MRRLTLLALLVLPAVAHAQGTCRLGTAQRTIVPNLVSADVFNTGALFFGNQTTNGDGYSVPRASGRSPIFAASLWLAGTVGGEIRASGARYYNFTFWPGPLGDGAAPTPDCARYDRIYRVSRQDVVDYYRTGIATDDLRDWPAALGAPVIDGDGDPATYTLAGGDQPALRGDDVAWWLMNDASGRRPDGLPKPLGVEVRVEAYGLARAPLDATSFYRYTVTNRTAVTIDSVYAGLFVDPDLGNATDDYTGTDTTGAMAYVYNGDNDDDGAYGYDTYGYGVAPPAVGFQVVNGPVGLPNGRDDDRDGVADEPGERLGLTASTTFPPSCAACTINLDGARQYSLLMKGRWADGTEQREYGYGYGYSASEGAVTRFMYAGDPVAGRAWSEVNNATPSPVNRPGDRRFVVATGPFRLAPGASETVTFAIPYARGTSNLDSVTRLRNLARGLRRAFADPEPVPVPRSPRGTTLSGPVRLSRPSPNPFTARAAVRYEMDAGTTVRATLLDVLGREVALLFDGPAAATGEFTIDGTGLAPGVYRVRVVVPAGEQILTLVRGR